jgi:hypothetical protein
MNLLHAPAGLGASLRRIMNASDPAKSTANAIKPPLGQGGDRFRDFYVSSLGWHCVVP